MMYKLGSILLSPVIPVWLIILCAILFAGLAWRTYAFCSLKYSERWILWSLRMLAFGILAFLLLQPSRRETRSELEKPVLAVLLDLSASMQDNPYAEKMTRADKALAFLKKSEVRKHLEAFRVLYFTAGSSLQEGLDLTTTPKFSEPSSLLAPAINQVAERLRAEPQAGILLLSDGLDQSNAWLEGRAQQIPVLIPELENPVLEERPLQQDFSIENIHYPRRAILQWEVKVEVTIRRRHGSTAQTFPVELLQNGSMLRKSEAVFRENENFRKVEFSFTAETLGNHLYQLSILPLQDADAGNNHREFVIDVTDARKRILYLEGTPRWEFKYLKRSLLAEKNQELNAFLQSGTGAFLNFSDTEHQEALSLPEFSPESLRDYSVVILGDLKADALKEKDYRVLTAFVEKGGALLFLAGTRTCSPDGVLSSPHFKELAPVFSLPGAQMREGRFSVDFTAAGRSQNAFSDLLSEVRLPPLLSFWGPVEASSFASVFLAAADGSAVLVGRRYGQGRTAVLLSDSLWRWQLGSEAGGGGKSLYGRFLTQLLQWLAPGLQSQNEEDSIQLLLPSREADLRAKISIGALCGKRVSGSGLACRILCPDASNLALPMLPAELGIEAGLPSPEAGFRCEFVPEQEGTYRLQVISKDGLASEEALLVVKKPALEFTGEAINRQWLQRLAKDTGGAMLPWLEAGKLLEKLPVKPRSVEIVREYS
ncbi:MAG: hypothetical protein GX927_08765, partial [Lentisphaerae bacterium]|nr:hypothetical protein [Lentisphaerota bacterium]